MTDLREAYLVTGVRTPIGRYGGAHGGERPDDLAAHVIRALTERLATVDWAAIDDVVLGCANQAGEDNRNVARMATLLAGLPETVSASTVNRLCGSGLDAMAIGARAIRTGDDELRIAGADRASADGHRVQSGAAEPVDRAGRNGLWQAGEQRRHPRHVAVVLPGLVRTTENHVVDRRPVDGGQPFGQGADHVRGQVVGAHGGERPAVPADRSPYAGDEVGLSQVGHDRVPSPDPVSANSSEPPIARLLPRNSATTDPSARRTVTS